MSKKETVLIICPFFRPNTGGVETHLDDLCNYLSKNEHQVYVITYQPLTTRAKGLRMERAKNLEIRRIQWFGRNLFHKLEPYPFLEFLYLFPVLFVCSFFVMVKHRREIDAIHAHGLTAALVARLITLFFKKRTVMSTHAIYGFENRRVLSWIVRWILAGIDVVMPLAERSKKDLMAAGVPEGKLKIYTQWVDQSLFRPRDKKKCREKLGLGGELVVLFVGRLIEKKGTKILLEASRRLPSEIKFVFVGDGPLELTLSEAAKNQSNIIAVGKKTQEEISEYYGAADLVLIPSQYEEGFARVTLEALSSGRPILAANSGCLPEMVNSKVGILLKSTLTNIADQIRFFFDNPVELGRLTDNCREYALEHFSERNAKLIEDCYKE